MTRYRELKKATAEVVGVRLLKKASTTRAHEAIRDLIVANPALSYQQIADVLGCSRWLVSRAAIEFGVRRPRGAGSPSRRKEGQ
jgi:AraC-like DNA-binding protein